MSVSNVAKNLLFFYNFDQGFSSVVGRLVKRMAPEKE